MRHIHAVGSKTVVTDARKVHAGEGCPYAVEHRALAGEVDEPAGRFKFAASLLATIEQSLHG